MPTKHIIASASKLAQKPLAPSDKLAESTGVRWPVDKKLIHDESAGRRPSMLFRALETALYANDIATVKEIIAERPEALDETNQYGCPPLMLASSGAAVRLLLPYSNPDAKDDDGGTALGYMADLEDTSALKALLPHADPNLADGFGVTPLMAAARGGRSNSVKLLLPKSDASLRDKHGLTALMHAAQNNAYACAMALLAASDPNANDHAGMDALMHAASRARYSELTGTLDSEKELLAVALIPYCDPTRADNEGLTALDHVLSLAIIHDSISPNSMRAARALMPRLDAKAFAAKDARGRTVVERARAALGSRELEFQAELEQLSISSTTSAGILRDPKKTL